MRARVLDRQPMELYYGAADEKGNILVIYKYEGGNA